MQTFPNTAQTCDRLLQLMSPHGRLYIQREEEMPCCNLERHATEPSWQYLTYEWDQASWNTDSKVGGADASSEAG